MTDQSNQRPVCVLRDGMLKAAIWRNEGENGPFFTATLSKLFEKNGELRDGHSFAGGELLKVSELARQAYNEIRLHRAGASQKDEAVDHDTAEISP